MAKFPTDVEDSVTVRAPLDRVYAFLADPLAWSDCMPGIDECKKAKGGAVRYRYKERTAGPVSMTVCFTVRYEGNGADEITFESVGAAGDNTEVRGAIRLKSAGKGSTRITFKQMAAPDTPIPGLLQGMVRSLVEREAANGLREQLDNIKRTLEQRG